MKLKFYTILLFSGFAFAGCNAGRNDEQITDSAIMSDTIDMMLDDTTDKTRVDTVLMADTTARRDL